MTATIVGLSTLGAVVASLYADTITILNLEQQDDIVTALTRPLDLDACQKAVGHLAEHHTDLDVALVSGIVRMLGVDPTAYRIAELAWEYHRLRGGACTREMYAHALHQAANGDES